MLGEGTPYEGRELLRDELKVLDPAPEDVTWEIRGVGKGGWGDRDGVAGEVGGETGKKRNGIVRIYEMKY